MRSVPCFIIVFSLFLSSCASIFTGTSDNVVIKSDPNGADIYINGARYGETPAVVNVKRSINSKSITIKKDGYKPVTRPISNEFNSATLWNLLFWPGFAIDAISGAMFKSEGSIIVDLDKKD